MQYRDTPIVCLHHLTGVLDDWDPAVIDGLAKRHRVVLFDNRGVGGSEGKTPDDLADMARDAVAFVAALGLKDVDLVGFSMGGFISGVGAVIEQAAQRADGEHKHPKQFLFFSPTTQARRPRMPDGGHGAIFQYHERFVEEVVRFLAD